MSLDSFKDTLYKQLPSQNLAFVEGGVFVCPTMFGLNLPSSMSDEDLYRYLSRYTRVMDVLSKVDSEQEGRRQTLKIAEKLQVPPQKFMDDTKYMFMTECVMQNKMLPMDFKTIKEIYKNQARRCRVIMLDLMDSIDRNLIDNISKMDSSITTTPKINKMSDHNQKILQSVDKSEEPKFELVPQLSGPEEDSKSIISSMTSFVSKPPVMIGLAALIGYALVPKDSKEDFRE